MNAKQKAELIRLVRTDCKLRHHYMDASGKTCVLGCLALAAGFPPQFVRNLSGSIQSFDSVAEKIEKRFGINRWNQFMLQQANDTVATLPARRKAILKRIENII